MADPRLRPIPSQILDWARGVRDRRGTKGAAKVLGIAPTTVMSILAIGEAMPGTLALLERAWARKQAAGSTVPPCSQCGEPALFSHGRQHFCREHGRVLLERLAGGHDLRLLGGPH